VCRLCDGSHGNYGNFDFFAMMYDVCFWFVLRFFANVVLCSVACMFLLTVYIWFIFGLLFLFKKLASAVPVQNDNDKRALGLRETISPKLDCISFV
jgi:hypothetical protein